MAELQNVFVTVGTDVHPFDRMTDWVDAWAADGDPAAHLFMQSGTSRVPQKAEHSPYLSYTEMEDRVHDADAVVCHGGPGTIMLAVALGKMPIVAPRNSSLGEHVDDHQMAFCARIAADGAILLAQSEDDFRTHLSCVLKGDALPPRSVSDSDPAQTAARFEELVNGLFRSPPRTPAGSRC